MKHFSQCNGTYEEIKQKKTHTHKSNVVKYKYLEETKK